MNLPKAFKSLNINNQELSYINASLQAFIQLDCVQNWMKYLLNSRLIDSQNFETTITKDISFQLQNLSNGFNPDTSQIIKNIEMKIRNYRKKELPADPFHFLSFFLELLHCENNMPKNRNFNFDLYKQKMQEKICNDYDMFTLFNFYLEQTQNSFFSDYFYNIQKYHVNCPFCLMMYNYGQKMIIRFNVDEIILKRNEFEPLKANAKISLNDCFVYSSKMKAINCQVCKQSLAYEFKQIYNSSQVLIIAFNRKNDNKKYMNDVRFYLDFDISNHIINQNCENKKYKLKSVIYRYAENKYFSDVYIYQNFYRFMDCKQGTDVKIIQDVNELMVFEPVILFYEVDYQSQMFEKMKNMSMNQNFPNMSNISDTMKLNLNLINNFPSGFQMYDVIKYFPLKFLVIPQIWDSSEENAIKINVQVSNNFTIEEAVNRFFYKLAKPREAIIRFSINNIQLDPHLQQKLKDMNINENSTIYALKSNDFNELILTNNQI